MRAIYSDGVRLFFLLHLGESRRGASPLEPIATVSAIALQQEVTFLSSHCDAALESSARRFPCPITAPMPIAFFPISNKEAIFMRLPKTIGLVSALALMLA